MSVVAVALDHENIASDVRPVPDRSPPWVEDEILDLDDPKYTFATVQQVSIHPVEVVWVGIARSEQAALAAARELRDEMCDHIDLLDDLVLQGEFGSLLGYI